MGSRYGGDYRRSGDLGGYRGSPTAPTGPRWDSDRFAREREERIRGPPVIERDRVEYEKDRFARGGGFEERIFAEERYGPPARRPERRYYEDDFFDTRSRAPAADAIIPYRPRREEPPPPPPPRPGLLRRQSSLDTFDRRPMRRFEEFEEYRSPPPIAVPLPPRRASPPRYAPRYGERDVEEIRVSEPDFYGDEEFRTYKEREWTNRRTRSRRRSHSSEVRERISEEEIIEEAPWPRRGKTKMPRSKVHLRAIVELGYPFEEEGETVILLKALNKQQIDEVIALSQEFREREQVTTTTTIHLIEPPPREEIIEKERVTHVPMSEAPRSVREWDTLKVERRSPSPTRTTRTRRSRSHHSRARSRRGSSPEMIVEKREIIREVSPARTIRTRRNSRASSPSTIVEKREIIQIDDRDESNSVHAGPLPLVIQDRRRKTERELKEEIRALEAERRMIRLERAPREREVIIERERPEEVIEVRKDKKASPPDPRLIRAMMATLT